MNYKHNLFVIFLGFLILGSILGCNKDSNSNKINSNNSVFENNEINPAEEVKRTDTYTKFSEKVDLEKTLFSKKESFKETLPINYHLSATVTISHEQDANRLIYEVLMDKYTTELTNVIQSFTLNPDMINYFLTDDLTTTNTLNDNETNLFPNKEPYGLSLFRGYVINNDTVGREIENIYQDVYLKISYGSKEDRKEDYWHLKAVPSTDMIDYLKSLKEE
ncbi:hypothetical protein [Paenibacillus aceti]|uniref:Lipoprotein n=1 Tax=Paenibacillus aceti TaxID=1820010 RepID=A0ABQ1W6Z1_9BACL|nr:hypothetical protein [Paenibacillus aceti]GGG16526.1 hypothetical protein GCM10010913_43190 [Paenibacillus aceti]